MQLYQQLVVAGLERAQNKGHIGGRPRIPKEKVAAIFQMRKQGMSLRKIAREIGVHHGKVSEYQRN